MTVIAFAAVFTGLGIVSSSGNYMTAIELISGVFLGSALLVVYIKKQQRKSALAKSWI